MFYVEKILILLVALAHTVKAEQSSGGTSPDGCFTQYPNSQVQCLKPMEVCENVPNDDECRKICLKRPSCTGAQYQDSIGQCLLFNKTVVITYGGSPPSGNAGCGYSPPTLKRNVPDFCFSQRTTNYACGAQPVVPETQPPPVVTPAPPPPETDTPMPPPTMPPVQVTTTMAPIIMTTPVAPPQANCPSGQSVLYYEYPGMMSNSQGNAFAAPDEKSCVQACTDNKLPDGTPSPCLSADFNTQSMQCKLISTASSQDQLTAEPNTHHYERTCVDSSTVPNCQGGTIVVIPQKILVGYVESLVTSPSQQDCLQQCLNSQQRFGFKCASGMFYPKETKDNCILNSESASTQPTLVTDEPKDPVNYFEPLCGAPTGLMLSKKKGGHREKRQQNLPQPPRRRNILWVNNPNWGSWTRCDGVESKRKHYRNCQSFNPSKCEVASESCDPKNRAKEQQDIRDDEAAPFTSGPAQPGATTASEGGGMGGQVTATASVEVVVAPAPGTEADAVNKKAAKGKAKGAVDKNMKKAVEKKVEKLKSTSPTPPVKKTTPKATGTTGHATKSQSKVTSSKPKFA